MNHGRKAPGLTILEAAIRTSLVAEDAYSQTDLAWGSLTTSLTDDLSSTQKQLPVDYCYMRLNYTSNILKIIFKFQSPVIYADML